MVPIIDVALLINANQILMKTLFLIRHAEAAYADDNTNDFERPLTEAGLQQANQMAEKLKTFDIKPDLIISSSALRALTTAKIMADVLHYPNETIKTVENIYSGGIEDLMETIRHTDKTINTLLLVGHNPNLSWLTNYLCEKSNMNLPTCGITGITFKEMKNWNTLTEETGELLHFICPSYEHF